MNEKLFIDGKKFFAKEIANPPIAILTVGDIFCNFSFFTENPASI